MALTSERIGTDRAIQPIGMIVEYSILRCSGEPGYKGWCINPTFQRGLVWTLAQKVAWIESILMGIGMPTIFVNRFPEEHPVYGWSEIVIDGQQRLNATAEFMTDKFRVRGELYSAQPKVFKRGFVMHDGLTPVVYCNYKTERECAELYLRLLRSGTAHTTEEMRKAEDFIKGCRA